ncbi:MAG TPA: phosphoribosyltransferase family protein [Candidatus Dormibacteraeota bacterium]|nr:phosphoribosyltransferase family protein [Candidatus Dormibacteraeota bacterium]
MAELLSLVATKHGHFRLESGYHADVWLELDQLFVRPTALKPLIAELAGRVAIHGVDVVCGPLTGGAFLADLMAVELGVDFAFSERTVSDRTGLFPVDYRIKPALRAAIKGRRVAVVDDAISMGSAVRATAADLEVCEATPVVIAALLVMGPAGPEFAAAKQLPLERLADLATRIWLPSECQLCASGIPVADP